MNFDLLLRGGRVVDGTGAPERRADVGIVGGRIAHVGPVPDSVTAARTVELTGLVLAPGFIDIHTHSDVSLLHDPAGDEQGTAGRDDRGDRQLQFLAVPGRRDRSRAALSDHLARLGDAADPSGLGRPGRLTPSLQANPPALNVAALVGHGALRIAAMADPYGPSTEQDRAAMADLVDTALEQGAFGFSTGLTHTPSSIGPTAEIDVLAAVCARHDGLYATHARAVAGHELDGDPGGDSGTAHAPVSDWSTPIWR